MSSSLSRIVTRSIEDVESKIATIHGFQLENGDHFPILNIAYETYGKLDESGSNAVLIMHGYAAHHHATGYYAPGKYCPGVGSSEPGWWSALIGPGKAIDTDRLFVISSNTLGSSYGTTGPASINSVTGKPYGPGFPDISIIDMINAQYMLLGILKVRRLVTVVGFSYGGYQAFQWAVTYPNMMDGVVIASATPKGNCNPQTVEDLVLRLSKDPNWNNGWYYDRGGIRNVLIDYRMEMLKLYGSEQQFMNEAAIRQVAESWAKQFDGNSLITLRRAAEYRNAEKDFERIKAKMLYVSCRTDNLFPPSTTAKILAKLNSFNLDIEYLELDSNKGHVAAIHDAAMWEPLLRTFISKLQEIS